MLNLFGDKKKKGNYSPDEVGRYYDEWTDRYQDVYGDVIQAYRPADIEELLDHTMERALLADDQYILDAGCGVAGPALHFATRLDAIIEGITISDKQVAVANERIAAANLKGDLKVMLGDYHDLDQLFPHGGFDRVLFLESLGHAQDPEQVIRAAHKVLKDEGYIYIKDFFVREVADAEFQKKINKVIKNMNESYSYNVLDLHQTLTALRTSGFHIDLIQRPPYASDITVRKTFEDSFGIDVFEGAEIMPAEWLEIRCQKLSW